MQSRVVDAGPCVKQVEVTVPPERIREALDRSFGELRTQVALPGFRPGRVPRGVLERRFGQHVRHEVLHDLMREGMSEALREHKLEPVSEPELEGHDEGSHEHSLPEQGALSFSFKVEIKPDFDLPPYKGVEVPRRVEPVTDDEVAGVLARLAERKARWAPVEDDRYLDGDLVVGSLTVQDGDVTLEDEMPVAFVIEDPVLVQGFELRYSASDALEHLAGEPRVVPAKVSPEHENERLRGKDVRAIFERAEFKRRTVPAIDDDLGKEAGFDGLDQLRADIRKKLEATHKVDADRRAVRAVIDKLLSDVEIPLAASPVKRMLDRRLFELSIEHRIQGADEETALARAKEKESEILASVERDTRSWLLLERIAKKEKIFCLEEDVDEAFAGLATEHGTTPTKVREHYEKESLLPELRASIIERKTCVFLRENARMIDEGPGEAAPPAEAGTGA